MITIHTSANLTAFPETPPPMSFVVMGQPAVKGSTFSFLHRGRVVTKTDSKNGHAWARTVALIARATHVPMIPKGIAVHLDAVYEFEPPIKPVRSAPCVRPDIDKLTRALLDALTGIAYVDDGQVTRITVEKIYGPHTCTRITVAAK